MTSIFDGGPKVQLSLDLQTMADALPTAEIAEAGRRLKGVTEELAVLEERWLELSGQIEAAEAVSG